MNGTRHVQDEPVPRDAVRAEAATWVARLHDDQRGPDSEARLHTWLNENEEHRRAFSRLTQVWERAGEIGLRAQGNMFESRRGQNSRFIPWAAAVGASLVLTVIGTLYWSDNALVTGVGQEKIRLLRDGTRIALNTDTRIEVNYDERARRVRLIRGEARFDVSKRPTWPFLVSVGDHVIRALGTSFIVRHDDIQDLSVILVEGQISVAPITPNDEARPQGAQILAPGQRLIISQQHASAMDRPELARVTAWERGRVDFEETTLADAVDEINRYTTTHVTIANAAVAQLRIGGVFRAGDSDEFVKVVTAAFGLRADRNGSVIVLYRPATQPPTSAVR
jgi:transmembrane sensor